MKIAVPCDENGYVVLHLKEARQYNIYDTLDDEILTSEIIVISEEASAYEPVGFLTSRNIPVLICGLLPVSVLISLQDARIQVLGGASGPADDRVKDFLGGTLHFDRGGSCASCSASCSLKNAGSQANTENNEEPECDGNISACGHWCH